MKHKFYGNQYIKIKTSEEDKELINKVQQLYDSNFGGVKKIAKKLKIGNLRIIKWRGLFRATKIIFWLSLTALKIKSYKIQWLNFPWKHDCLLN